MFLSLQVDKLMRLSAIEQIISDTKTMFIYFSIIDLMNHGELYQVVKTIFNIYICLNHCCWCEHNQCYKFRWKAKRSKVVSHLDDHFINRCGYFSLWLIIFKQGIDIYLNFFFRCMLTFIFYSFWMVDPAAPVHFLKCFKFA